MGESREEEEIGVQEGVKECEEMRFGI